MTIDDALTDHVAAVSGLVGDSGHVLLNISERIAACFAGGGKLLICGNGGSAADAQHFAAEFVNRMHMDRRALPALALSTDTSSMTAIANDASYERVFARQVEALGRPGDMLVALTTSGRSANVLAALEAARDVGMTTVGFTGRSGAAVLGPAATLSWHAVGLDSTHPRGARVRLSRRGVLGRTTHVWPSRQWRIHGGGRMSTATPGINNLVGSDWRAQAEHQRAAIEERLGGRREVVLFGSGYLGRQIVRDLDGLPFTALAFVDNNHATWGSQVAGLDVLSPEAAAERFGTAPLWLITVYTNSSVIRQLDSLGMPWMTCAELSWLLPEPHPQGFDFGTPESLARWDAQVAEAAGVWADEASARSMPTRFAGATSSTTRPLRRRVRCRSCTSLTT